MSLSSLALVAGAAIAVQAAMNARLGVLLLSPLTATVAAFFFSLVVTLTVFVVTRESLPTMSSLRDVPVYLWFGGVLSALGVGLLYFLIPKVGVGSVMTYSLCGQLLVAALFSHHGWLGLPQRAVDGPRLLGLALLIIGVVLFNRGGAHVTNA